MQSNGLLRPFSQPGTNIQRFLQPLLAPHRAEDMQLTTANDDVIGSKDGKTLDEIYAMSSEDRRLLFQKYLVNKDKPVLLQEPIAWSDDESIGRFLLLKKFLDDDDSKKHLLQEARRVFYEENSFVLMLSGLSRFLDDMLGDWEDAVPVEMLVRDLTVKVERDDCKCGQLLDYIQRLTYFAKMPQLQRIAIEWHSPVEYTDPDLPNDWSTLSSVGSSRGDSLNSLNSHTDDDGTCDSEDSNEALAWGHLEDDAWSLEEGVEG